MELKRKKFQGVLNILSFNRHYYVFGIAVLAILFISRSFIEWSDPWFWLIIGGFAYGLTMPLLVSAYVYDFSGYYEFGWLKQLSFNHTPARIVSINAGFDETSFIIKSKFPLADLEVFDFYNVMQHTEPAIKRARKLGLVYPGTRQIKSNFIPLKDHSVDIIFLLSSAHEIRSREEKILFLKECYRVCSLGGRVIMVEHLRDFSNFLAFSIGFTHFFSKAEWKKVFRLAGFVSLEETKFTPFMSIFSCNN
jgi:SAM-dependent methyltransferase